MIENRICMIEVSTILPRPEGSRLRDSLDWDWVSELGEAIRVQSLQTPILVCKETNTLLAGEHRLEAFKRNARLGVPCDFPGYKDWTVIPVRKADAQGLNAGLIELVENLLRKNMTWKEEAKGVYLLAEHVPQDESEDQEAYTERLSGVCGLSAYRIQMYLQIQNKYEHAQVQAASTITEAVNVTRRMNKREMDALTDSLGSLVFDMAEESGVAEVIETPSEVPVQAPESAPAPAIAQGSRYTLLNTSFIEFANSYSGQPFNFLHCDFPYGVGMDKSSMTNAQAWATYEDSADIYMELCKALIENKDKLLSSNCFVLFWYSEKFGDFTRDLFESAGFKRWTHPLIWHKSCNSGILPDYRRGPRHTYENAMVFTLGDPFIVKPVADSYSGPATKEHGHVSEKPIPMLQHFLRLFVDEHTRMLDPTAGSHTSLAVSLELGAAHVTGIELDPIHHAAGLRLIKALEESK